MTLVIRMTGKGDTHMQQIMRIGNEFVPVDDDIKDIAHASTEITDVAHKYKADVLAIIGKGEDHHLVAQHHANGGMLQDDIIKAISLIETMANTYQVNAADIADAIKLVIEEGEYGEE